MFVDQSGFYLLPTVVRTYAPVGQTPILHEHLTRDHLSVISAITMEGKLLMMEQERSFKSPDVRAQVRGEQAAREIQAFAHFDQFAWGDFGRGPESHRMRAQSAFPTARIRQRSESVHQFREQVAACPDWRFGLFRF